jgi:hypothetical protein
MKRSMRRLVGRLVMLGVLTCLLAFNFTHARASASCCTTCDPTLADCYNQCCEAGGLGACYDFCDRQYGRCESTCDPDC